MTSGDDIDMSEGTAQEQTKSPPPTRAEREEVLKSDGTPMRRRRIELEESETKAGIESYMHDTGIKSWDKVVDLLYEQEACHAAWMLTVIHRWDEDDVSNDAKVERAIETLLHNLQNKEEARKVEGWYKLTYKGKL